MMLPLVLVLALAEEAQARCLTKPDELQARAEKVINNYDLGNRLSDRWAYHRLELGVECLQEPPSSYQAALVHGAMGLRLAQLSKPDAASRAFAAMSSADPRAAPVVSEAAERSEVATTALKSSASLIQASEVQLSIPLGWSVLVDGPAPSATLPAELPVVVLVLDSDGLVYRATVLPPGSLPPFPDPNIDLLGWAQLPSTPRKVGFAALMTGVASAGLWAMKVSTRETLDQFRVECVERNLTDCDYTPRQIERITLTHNVSLVLAITTASVSASGGALSLAWPW